MLRLHRPSALLRPARLLPAISAGLLLVHATSSLAISNRDLFTGSGAALGNQRGYSVAPAGDFNGDGYDDVIVGEPLDDAANVGRATILFGGPLADGIADVTITGVTAGDSLGWSVASAGDVNSDGYDDVIVGAPGADNGVILFAGRAYVVLGGDPANGTIDVILSGTVTGEQFGYSVAGIGDTNGDGFDDVIVGSPTWENVATDAGRVSIFYGGAAMNSTSDGTTNRNLATDLFGFSVAGAGDVNGDGYSDFIVGIPGADDTFAGGGNANVFYGGAAFNQSFDFDLAPAAAGDAFGTSVALLDMNSDGFADFLVGAPNANLTGRAYVYLGGPDADETADLTLNGTGSGDDFGTSVARAGDVNGDGFDDAVIGAPNAGVVSADGVAYVYLGGSSLNATVDLTIAPPAIGFQFGWSLAGADDVDGDGYGDLVIGDPLAGPVSSAGRFAVHAVYPYQVVSPNGGEQWVAGEPATVRWRGHDVADLALSTDGGATYTTLFNSLGGAEDNEFTLTCPATPSDAAKVRLSFRGQTVTRGTSDVSDGVFRIVLRTTPPAAACRLDLAPTGAAPSNDLGWSAGSAGDVNGDGFGDVLVGAPFNSAGGATAGQAYVYFGGPSADVTADLTFTGGAAGDRLGWSVATAGDVNGDGYADVIVGAPLNDVGGAEAGQAYVYFGGPAPDLTADWTLTGAAAGDQFGYSVGAAGDVNGDGYADVIVGAPLNNAGGTDAGQAYVYFGGPAPDVTADWTLTGAAVSDEFGHSVGTAGDVNGDGYADAIVGALFNNAGGADAGRAYVYYGSPAPDVIADLTLTGEAAGDNFGVSVAGAGDVNGDGYADAIVGAPFNYAGGADAGRAYLYHGGPAADAAADLTLTGGAAGDEFGFSVGAAGDVNGDGFADAIVGARSNDAGGVSAGRAYLYHGGSAPDADADLTLTGEAAADLFGYAVGMAGDTKGDGFADVIVGAPLNDAGGLQAGRAYVYDCNRYFVLSPNDDEVWNVGAAQSVTWLGAESANLWLSTNGGATYDLLRHDVGGEESNALALLVPHTPTRFARVRVTPVDPGVRGADESDSLFTIQSSVALLSFAASLTERGAELSWSTDPGVGPEGLAGYRLYRIAPGEAGGGRRIGPDPIAESRYTDPDGAPRATYRLAAVNGLQEELELGRATIPDAPLRLTLWPTPLRAGDRLRVSFAAPQAAPGFPASDLDVGLFDLQGRRVATLARGPVTAPDGVIVLEWSADRPGQPVAPGAYFLRAAAPSAGFRAERKLVIVP